MTKHIEERRIKDTADVRSPVKKLTARLMQECIDAEILEELSNSKYGYRGKQFNQQIYLQKMAMKHTEEELLAGEA